LVQSKPYTSTFVIDGTWATPFSGKHLGWLLGSVFGVSPGATQTIISKEVTPRLAETVETVLNTLSPREERILRMRLGLNVNLRHYTQQKIADHFGISRYRVRQIESKALRKLRHPQRANLLKIFLNPSEREAQQLAKRSSPERLAELVSVIETVKRLEPSLIEHLQRHNDDLKRIHPHVFEHLFAEFLAARGFTDVRLVGRNPRTSADIFAAKFIPEAEIPIKVFVEVKRWRDTVGIGVINEVLGAFLGEKERFGWSAAIIVTVGGFKDFEKWSREELALKGLFLKERDDLFRYLEGYKQHPNGLWLPSPRTDLMMA
jgi:DNA-binding CsgD family transcriptional regulator